MFNARALLRYTGVAALALLWASEMWFVQALTTSPTLWHDPVAVVKDQVFRALLNFGLALTLLLMLPRWAFIPLFLGNIVFYGLILSYYETYDRAMSVFVIVEQWREGLDVAGGGALLVLGSLTILAAVGIAKFALLHRHRECVGTCRRPALGLALAWLAFVGILHLDHKDMARLATFEQVGGIAHVYGYLPTWAAELVYVEQDQVVEEAFSRLAIRSDQLGDVEAPMPQAQHIVLLQVESLDDAVIDFTIDGREVTPRLNALRDTSFYFRSQAQKLTGSCDTDFTALMGRLPSPRMVGYRIDELPFETAVVDAFADAGYRTGFWHGVSGTFFHRRDAFERMGFQTLNFREEFIANRGADPDLWTVSDGDVFEWAATWPGSADRTFTMVITATSHLPFNFPTPGYEPTFFPGSQLPNRSYFDSIAYVDASIGAFVDSLPEGTLVLIYGDHWSKMRDSELGYDHTVIDGFGLVPVMVHVVGSDISPLQRTRDTDIALDGRLTLLDIFTWAWTSLEPVIAWTPDGRLPAPPAAPSLAVEPNGALARLQQDTDSPLDTLLTLFSL